MRTKPKRLPRLDTPAFDRMLDHLARARLARIELRASGMKVQELADRAGVHPSTVLRFCGLGVAETLDPRTSTTVKILGALGWKARWEKVR